MTDAGYAGIFALGHLHTSRFLTYSSRITGQRK